MTDGYTNDGGRSTEGREGFGDDQGTRVGRPDSAGEKSTGAGAEGAEGIHSAGVRDASQPSGVNEHRTGREGRTNDAEQRAESGMSSAGGRSGSEPLAGRQGEHRSGYGGSMGEPVTSSDEREGNAQSAAGGSGRDTDSSEGGHPRRHMGDELGRTGADRLDAAGHPGEDGEGSHRRPREQMEEDI